MALSSPKVRLERVEAFQREMDKYLNKRQRGLRNSPSLFTRFLDEFIGTATDTAKDENGTLTIFGRFTLKNKRDAIIKINNELNGKSQNDTYSEIDIDSARDGDLGKILEQFDDVLPAKFKSKESAFKDAQSKRMDEREVRMRK